jgi:hypothetical protein
MGNHTSGMKDKCAVVSCTVAADPGFRTCPKPGHRAAEDCFTEHGKAMFQLKEHLAKTYKMRTIDAVASIHLPPEGSQEDCDDNELDEVSIDHAGDIMEDCGNDKPEGGHRKIYTQFGR